MVAEEKDKNADKNKDKKANKNKDKDCKSYTI